MQYTSENPVYNFLLAHGWTEKEIEKYIPYLETLDSESLWFLHEMLGIQMFFSIEQMENDKQLAVWALVNPMSTPKEYLLRAIKTPLGVK